MHINVVIRFHVSYVMSLAFWSLLEVLRLLFTYSRTPWCYLWLLLCLVNLAFYCLPEGPSSVLRLQSKGPRSAVFVDLNVRSPYIPTTDQQTDAARCQLEVMAPPGHELTVHLDHPKKALPSRSSEERHGFLPCFLRLVSIPHCQLASGSRENARESNWKSACWLRLERHLQRNQGSWSETLVTAIFIGVMSHWTVIVVLLGFLGGRRFFYLTISSSELRHVYYKQRERMNVYVGSVMTTIISLTPASYFLAISK